MNSSLAIAGTIINQDSEQRFSLKDIHKASGGTIDHHPDTWLALRATKRLISKPDKLLTCDDDTFVSITIAYSYATWISQAFYLQVRQAYDESVAEPYQVYVAPRLTPVATPNAANIDMLDTVLGACRRAEAIVRLVSLQLDGEVPLLNTAMNSSALEVVLNELKTIQDALNP